MGCAFSSTQIFLVDSSKQIEKKGGNNNTNNNNNNFVRFNRSGTTTIIGGNGGGAALLLASKYGKDVILVGQIKSNGCRRRPSSEAKFIEQRRKLSSNISVNKEGNNNSKNLFQKINRLADSTTYVGDTAPISGPIDFQKRLQNLKIKRTEEINEENKIEKNEEFKTEKNEISPKEQEKEFIMHRAEQESIITDGGLDHQNNEWDTLSNTTLSADCCSQIGGRIGLQQQQLHDGDVSEASFVLVKRKLKIAWEHHQIRQIRKQSLLRKERITENNCCDNMLQTPQQIKNIERRLSNNWIPEITKLNDEN
uniref:Uncharacterized protein n=1 Tax=Meloidogyne enterolobii TaxID=390850 RepID=A0A6V7VD26_MELEN|nr:unnamed protein product [Meloidogyne enterolobii]